LLLEAGSWAWGHFGNREERERSPFVAATKQWQLYSCLFRDRCLATGLHTTISTLSTVFPSVCHEFSMLFEYPELLLLFVMGWMCSLYYPIFGGCAWLIDGFWIDDRIYCTLT
jgi:hypothetical protein